MDIIGIIDLDNIIYDYVIGSRNYRKLVLEFETSINVVELKNSTIIIYNDELDNDHRATDYYWNGAELSFGNFDSNLNLILNTYIHDYWLETFEPFNSNRHILLNYEIQDYILDIDEDIEDMFMCDSCYNHIFDGICKECHI